MTPRTSARRLRYASLGLPAAVLGALAGTLAPAAAGADVVATTAPLDRLSSASNRVAPQQVAPATYTVVAGDTVSAIAGRFGLRTADVLAWNGLTAQSVIQPGQTLTLSGPASVAPPAPAASTGTYTISAGDTLFALAQTHGVSLDSLLGANGLDRSSIIYPGQTLTIPGASAVAPAAAPSATPPPPATASAPTSTYTVVAGDTLFGIAQRHGSTLDALLAANGLDRASIIYPGQNLALTGTPPAAAAAVVPPVGQQSADLSAEQNANAALIIRIGRELGVSDRGIAIALATGMVESGLRNLDWGDRDSLGLFQQRPSTGWGTPAQVQDAERSARVFYGGPSDPNGSTTRGLLDIPGWETMPFTDAAQAVQISAYPDRYGQWESAAYRWLGLTQ
ncbi:LysM peptidoglycan-binding domain-containing protein [Microbacterium sp. NPDC087665]|uniref:LysM peptidoglycan-binding domain-containing protein n=1 Tax=Microbacterium sp. NPDC087665 TaxID=3364194 RepID=UPI003800FC66